MTDIHKDSVTFHVIAEEKTGQRIDNYLTHLLKGVPKSHIYRILRSGEVRVNKGRVSADYRVTHGDLLRIPPIRIAKPTKSFIPHESFVSVFEDDAILVIDKPAGVAVHGGSGLAFGVIEQLRTAHPEYRFLELAHRLDRETSGLLILAKKRAALLNLHDMMRLNRAKKRYLALAIGHWPDHCQHIKLPLCKFITPNGERRVTVDPAGQFAHTAFTVQKRFQDYTLLEAQLQTGRTHQIRVHMAANACPIAGDEKYGNFAVNRQLAKHGLKRMFLHAWRLVFSHPLTNVPLTLEAPLPPELTRLLNTIDHAHRNNRGARLEP